MGLALHDPISSLPDLTEHRHLPLGRSFTKANKSKISKQRFYNWNYRYDCHLADGYHPLCNSLPPKLRPHQVTILASTRRAQWPIHFSAKSASKLDGRTRRSRAGDEAEGQDLARSRVRLPSDGSRSGRPPSLERQEAFRDADTAKKRQRTFNRTHDIDDAELYRLGLLYDDEHERGSGFSLDTIVHDQPVYSLNVRANKRGRKHNAAVRPEIYETLPLDLSFAALTDDDAVARYLISPTGEELPSEDAEFFTSHGQAAERPSPITIIYELDDGSLLSLHDNDNTAGFPDLISDSDDDDDGNGDWAILRRGSGEDSSGGGDDSEDAASSSPDAWIVLG